jgi:hypothetical protein
VLILYPDSNVNRSPRFREAIPGVGARPRTSRHGEFLDFPIFETRIGASSVSQRKVRPGLDVVVALGPNSLRKVVNNRSILFPNVPIVFCCASTAMLPPSTASDAAGLIGEFDIDGISG